MPSIEKILNFFIIKVRTIKNINFVSIVFLLYCIKISFYFISFYDLFYQV